MSAAFPRKATLPFLLLATLGLCATEMLPTGALEASSQIVVTEEGVHIRSLFEGLGPNPVLAAKMFGSISRSGFGQCGSPTLKKLTLARLPPSVQLVRLAAVLPVQQCPDSPCVDGRAHEISGGCISGMEDCYPVHDADFDPACYPSCTWRTHYCVRYIYEQWVCCLDDIDC